MAKKKLNGKTKMTRSENMARVKGKDTKPEVYVRKLLRSAGYGYRIHCDWLPGKPDIYLPKYKTAIFVHGCFWHAHENCRMFRLPHSNTKYWIEKLKKNTERDAKNRSELLKLGIKTIIIWGCTVKDMMKHDLKQIIEMETISEILEQVEEPPDVYEL